MGEMPRYFCVHLHEKFGNRDTRMRVRTKNGNSEGITAVAQSCRPFAAPAAACEGKRISKIMTLRAKNISITNFIYAPNAKNEPSLHRMSLGDMMKKAFAEKLGEKLSIPTETMGLVPYIEIRGQRSVSIENHKGILKYQDDEIRICVKNGTISVKGTVLKIGCLNHKQIVIYGKIQAVLLG